LGVKIREPLPYHVGDAIFTIFGCFPNRKVHLVAEDQSYEMHFTAWKTAKYCDNGVAYMARQWFPNFDPQGVAHPPIVCHLLVS